MIARTLATITLLLATTALLFAASALTAAAQQVDVFVTSKDASLRLQRVDATLGEAPADALTIAIDPSKTFQTIDGFGYTLTEGSAEAIAALTPAKQQELLEDLFDPRRGIGVSVLRIGVGATDLSATPYAYHDRPGDDAMEHFSMAGPDADFLLPLLKRVRQINPQLKLMATPWSAPRWMKTNDAWVGGSLRPESYAAYARYFVRYLQEMKRQGLEVWALTPQNEPENPHNEPSMVMTAAEQLVFIDEHLGPALQQAGLKTKIFAFDHNADHPEYPIAVLEGTGYADGAAFHLYAGNIEAMGRVHEATGKEVHFTEQWMSSEGEFGGDLAWHVKNVLIGGLRNHARSVLEWNLATDASFGPHTPGGCSKCRGAITVLGPERYERNAAFDVIAHASKFVSPGAVRVESIGGGESLRHVALRNPDGSTAAIVLNDGRRSQTAALEHAAQTASVKLEPGSVATFFFRD